MLTVTPISRMRGTVNVPGDKSISHRAVMLGSLAEGTTIIRNFLHSQDCLSTVKCMQQLGAAVTIKDDGSVQIEGGGLEALAEPTDVLDAGNSGTTMRLLLGILATQPFFSVITGDASLRRRPMDRVGEPLKMMGATFLGRNNGKLAPIAVQGGNLKPISYRTPVASAQLKSSILLAALNTPGQTCVTEPAPSRDHTERMLRYFGASLHKEGLSTYLQGAPRLKGREVVVPGDISSAAFFMVAACIIPDSEILIKDVGINPLRTGIIDVLRSMGADITIHHPRTFSGEPVADIVVRTSSLHGTKVGGDLIPRLIDEIPVLAVAAAYADGNTIITDAAELKVKESNRIATMASELSSIGADVRELDDGLFIKGGQPIQGGICDSHGDHRIAMSLAIAGLSASGPVTIKNSECIDVSFPGFLEVLKTVSEG
ncbi:MAG: 3-phosphoshikimate 1-carboxyvinyltransferase [Peptococcaceae bacterium]|nr:3-phosphoshikimate 1-carboxyvinyltransferase [Peptococcaceae bacterium]